MIARGVPFLIGCSFCVSALAAGRTWAGAAEEVVTFANKAASELGSSPLVVPQFKSATVDAVEDLGRTDDCDRYLCWLKNSKGRAGYMAVAGRAGAYQILAFSATVAPPAYFLRHLQVSESPGQPLQSSLAVQTSFLENVPLVAATETALGIQPLQISEIAASLSSVLNYMQNETKTLFFAHIGVEFSPEYTQRFRESPAGRRLRQDPNWQSFEDECRQAVTHEGISLGQRFEEKAAARVRARNVIKPIVRRRLLKPVDGRERLTVLQKERLAIQNVTPVDISSGMRDAILLQEDYVDGSAVKLKQNLGLFLKTRGLRANLEIVPFGEVSSILSPVVVVGPNDIAGVLLGQTNIGGERFASVLFPRTGKLAVRRLADSVGPRGLPDPNEGKDARAKKDLARLRTAMEDMRIARDRRAKWPESLGNGVHLCRASSLARWRVVVIDQIESTDN